MGVCNCLCLPLGLTNQPCQPTSSSSYLLRRHSPCPAPPPTLHVQYQKQLLVHQESWPTAPSVPPVRSARGRREECASGLECSGEECIVDQTALPGCCSQPGACKGVPGTCRSKRSSGGTEVKRNWKDWTEWGPCSAACGLGTRTRLRSATGEEGFKVEHGECKGDCSDDNENTNAVEPPEETFIPFFSSGIF